MDLIYHSNNIFCYLLLPYPQQPLFKLPQNESQLLNVLLFLTLITFPDILPQVAATHPACSHSNLFILDHPSASSFASCQSFWLDCELLKFRGCILHSCVCQDLSPCPTHYSISWIYIEWIDINSYLENLRDSWQMWFHNSLLLKYARQKYKSWPQWLNNVMF